MPRLSIIATVVASLLALAPPAAAAPDDQRTAPSAESGRASPDDGELSAFVAAFLRMIGVQHGYMMLMRDEEDPARLEEIRQSALVDMKSAVERDGMSVERYNQIAMSVRDDPTLRDRIEGMLQQLAAEPDGEASPPDGG